MKVASLQWLLSLRGGIVYYLKDNANVVGENIDMKYTWGNIAEYCQCIRQRILTMYKKILAMCQAKNIDNV